MPQSDPFHQETPFEYECVDCGSRVRAEQHPGECENCGGAMQDVSISRE